jgi:hypothetical protein
MPGALISGHCCDIEDDYKSGRGLPHSKASRSFALNLIHLALKSRARINRRCGDRGEMLLHLFFKNHKRAAKFRPSLRDEEYR